MKTLRSIFVCGSAYEKTRAQHKAHMRESKSSKGALNHFSEGKLVCLLSDSCLDIVVALMPKR